MSQTISITHFCNTLKWSKIRNLFCPDSTKIIPGNNLVSLDLFSTLEALDLDVEIKWLKLTLVLQCRNTGAVHFSNNRTTKNAFCYI